VAKGLLEIRVDGAEAVKVSFDMTRVSIRNRIRDAVRTAGSSLHAAALANLAHHHKTGTLEGSITDVGRETDSAIYWKVGTGPAGFYGRMLEKGVTWNGTVKGYMRAKKYGQRLETVKVGYTSVRAEGPRPLRVSKKTGKLKPGAFPRAKVATFKPGKVYETGAADVSSYPRTTKIQPHPWLAPALDSVRASFRSAVQAIADTPEG
jgi:hypothetical protein